MGDNGHKDDDELELEPEEEEEDEEYRPPLPGVDGDGMMNNDNEDDDYDNKDEDDDAGKESVQAERNITMTIDVSDSSEQTPTTITTTRMAEATAAGFDGIRLQMMASGRKRAALPTKPVNDFIRKQFIGEAHGNNGNVTRYKCIHCGTVKLWKNFNATLATQHITSLCKKAAHGIKEEALLSAESGKKAA